MPSTVGAISGGRACVRRYTYQTPAGTQNISAQGVHSLTGGYEGPVIQIGPGIAPYFLTELQVFVSTTAGAPVFVQVYDGSLAINPVSGAQFANGTPPPTAHGQPWNPLTITQVNPGQAMDWEPPREGSAILVEGHKQCDAERNPWGARFYDDDYGYPFDYGCTLAISSTSQGFTPAGENLVRVFARLRVITAGSDHS